MTKRTICATTLLLLTLLPSGVRADSLFGMSYFGQPTTLRDARIEGRGGMGLAYRDSVNASVMQATQLVDLTQVTIGVSNVFSRRTSEDVGGALDRNGLSTPTVRLGLPVFDNGGVGLGFGARRATQWTIVRDFAPDPTLTETLDRSGTLFDVPIQEAWRFADRVTVGAGLHLLRGNVRMEYELDLPASGATDPTDEREDIYQGTATEFSLAVHDVGPVSVAGYWISDFDADVEERQRGVALSDRSDGERTDEMPARYGAGIRVDLPGDWSAGVDYTAEDWSSYTGRSFRFGEDGAFDPDAPAQDLNDEIEWRFGLEREARRRGFGATLPVRAGAYWRQWHYQLNGSDVTEWGVTLGSGVYLRGGSARADLSIGYSRIGDLDENGASEDVFRIVLSIAGGERWY